MKSKLAFAGLLAGALLLPALSSAADDQDADRAHPKAFVKDSAITTKIKAGSKTITGDFSFDLIHKLHLKIMPVRPSQIHPQ